MNGLSLHADPAAGLASLLDGVHSVEQSREWAADFRAASHLLTEKERIDLVCKAAAQHFTILQRG